MLPTMINDKYTIEKPLGKGGLGSVYVVYDHHIQSRWAMKVMQKSKDCRYVVKQEIEMLKQLQHAKLPRVIDVLEDDENYMIVMDYMQGIDLKQYLLCNGKASTKTVINWGLQLCDVLSYLHQHDPMILYLDLKPENIMVQKQELVLVDFGAARFYEQSDEIRYGSVGFAAPEQFDETQTLNQQADIYALGATLLYAWTLDVTTFPACKKKLDRNVKKIIQRCMMKNPQDRYETIQDVQNEFKALVEPKKRHIFLIIVCILLLGYGFLLPRYEARTFLKLQDVPTKWDRLEQDIQQHPTSMSAYQRLFDDYLQDDVFSQEEELHFVSHVEPFVQRNRENMELCYKIACLYQYYEVEMDASKTEKVCQYFRIAMQSNNTAIKQEATAYVKLLTKSKHEQEYFALMQEASKTKLSKDAAFRLYHNLLSLLMTHLPSLIDAKISQKDLVAYVDRMKTLIDESDCYKNQKDRLYQLIEDCYQMLAFKNHKGGNNYETN